MSFKLVFDQTGDTIPFEPVNQEVLEFFIEQLNQQSLNKFHPYNRTHGQNILDRIHKLDLCIADLNKWLDVLVDTQFKTYTTDEYLDQDVLNSLHASWAKSRALVYNIQEKRKQFNFSGFAEQLHTMYPDDIQTPPLNDVLNKLGLIELYNSLNAPHIHTVEGMFNQIRYTVSDTWTKISDNPFPKTILTNDVANLRISFNHLGRTLYDKFINFDMDLEYDDENSYNELLGFVTLSLKPTQTIPLSPEYVSWCKQHNKVPSGDFLNIGNIPNLYENLTKYRIIIFRNLLSNNKFAIHKTKG